MATPYLEKTQVTLGDGQPGIQYDFPGDPRDIAAHTPFMAAAGVSGAVRLPGVRRSVQVPADQQRVAEDAMMRALGLYPATPTEPVESSGKPPRRIIYVGGNFLEVAKI